MDHRQRRWTGVLLGAAAFSALLTAITYGLILVAGSDRSGRPIDSSLLPVVAIAGAVFGAFNTWRTGHFMGGPRVARTSLGRLAVELTRACSGQPNEAKAARTVATVAVIPAAICGILLGTQLVGEGESPERLWLVCGGLAAGAGVGVLAAVWVVYRVFGFRPVVVLAAALLGGFIGLFTGAFLGKVLDSWWPWLLGPLGVLIGAAMALCLPPRSQRGASTPQQLPRLDKDADVPRP